VAFEPLQKKSLGASVFDQICDHIVDGSLRAGDRLPAERVLAEKLGVNRQAVREGLGRLEQLGLVHTRMGGGTQVLDFKRTAGLELIARLLVTRRGVDGRLVRSVLEMRRAMGIDVARMCAQRRTGDTIVRLRELVAAQRAAAGDVLEQQRLALQFWDTVVAGSDNLAYRLAYNSLEAAYGQVMAHMTRLMEDEVSAVDDYERLAGAIERGDAEAAAQACERIVGRGEAAITDVLQSLEAEQEGSS
jgi:GntR family transcriptional regulator, transcriptional repressor for pyruvate dehydrogenase complex